MHFDAELVPVFFTKRDNWLTIEDSQPVLKSPPVTSEQITPLAWALMPFEDASTFTPNVFLGKNYSLHVTCTITPLFLYPLLSRFRGLRLGYAGLKERNRPTQ